MPQGDTSRRLVAPTGRNFRRRLGQARSAHDPRPRVEHLLRLVPGDASGYEEELVLRFEMQRAQPDRDKKMLSRLAIGGGGSRGHPARERSIRVFPGRHPTDASRRVFATRPRP